MLKTEWYSDLDENSYRSYIVERYAPSPAISPHPAPTLAPPPRPPTLNAAQ